MDSTSPAIGDPATAKNANPPGLVDSPASDWATYQPPANQYDEAFDSQGARPHWTTFLDSLAGLGLPELKRRWAETQSTFHPAFTSLGPQDQERPWQLDPIPVLFGSEEATYLQNGLVQRARLLEALAQDLYGPQRALTSGILPPELILANPAFLRPLVHSTPVGNRWLYLYAANLGRDIHGRLWVLSDRTQAPSGAGYALENRIALSRMLPEAFRRCKVQRLARFFHNLQETLQAASPSNRDNPRIVLLTPGPHNPTYYEHAYLARYLGCTLAEGGDLTVRDSRVYLKVLGGLQPVDVILRRLNDDFCDPLELRPESLLGVPGLVQAVLSGKVVIGNALGTGLLETTAFLPYLEDLTRLLLSEDLLLPSVKTWWCGDPMACSYVLEHLHELVIKPAFPNGGTPPTAPQDKPGPARGGRRCPPVSPPTGISQQPIFGGELSSEDRDRLAKRIQAKPMHFVGQQRLTLSTAPVLAEDHLEARHVVVRAFLATRNGSFAVMPGGLTRVCDSAGNQASMREGTFSKDTWVHSQGPVSTFSMLPAPGQPVKLRRGGRELPSRVADNLYWLGRYIERAEGRTRLLRGILVRLTERSGLGEAPELPGLLDLLTALSGCTLEIIPSDGSNGLTVNQQELQSILHDASKPGSLASVLGDMAQVAGNVRDRLSIDLWRVLTEIVFPMTSHAAGRSFSSRNAGAASSNSGRPTPGQPQTQNPSRCARTQPTIPSGRSRLRSARLTLSDELDWLNRVVVGLAAFGGLAADSMTRGEGWLFLDIGRKLERCLQTITMLQQTLAKGPEPDGALLEAILEIADSQMTYRRRYLSTLQKAPVLDLLLADETNPRSLVYQLESLAENVERLPRERGQPGLSPEQRLLLSALTSVRLSDVEKLCRCNEVGSCPALEELLSHLAQTLPMLSDTLTQTYLAHLQASRHNAIG